jgi:hypothetical protein
MPHALGPPCLSAIVGHESANGNPIGQIPFTFGGAPAPSGGLYPVPRVPSAGLCRLSTPRSASRRGASSRTLDLGEGDCRAGCFDLCRGRTDSAWLPILCHLRSARECCILAASLYSPGVHGPPGFIGVCSFAERLFHMVKMTANYSMQRMRASRSGPSQLGLFSRLALTADAAR